MSEYQNYVKLDDKYKRPFNLLFKFLSKSNDNILTYERSASGMYLESTYGQDYLESEYTSQSIPLNPYLINFFEEIFKNYFDDYIEPYAGNEVDEYYIVRFICKVAEKQIVIETYNFERSGEHYDSTTVISELDEDKLNAVNTFMSNNEIETLMIDFEGSGDDGYMNDYGKTVNGDTLKLTTPFETVIEELLSKDYGGWYNNEGANGRIIVDIPSDAIGISITYYDRSLEPSGFELTISQ
jgi:hypothetical protein